jgi:hypothetical protein
MRSDLGQHAAPSRSRGVRPFPFDQLTMPPQQRIGRHDRGDLAQRAPTRPERSTCEPPVVIGEARPLPSQLPSQDAILFKKIPDGAPLPAISQG